MITNLIVYDQSDFAEFFVRESFATKEDGRPRHSATWCAYSSFGVFGHCWYSMGQPFGEFIADIDEGYLLSKIGREVFDEAKLIESMYHQIDVRVKEKIISRQTAREGKRRIKEIIGDFGGEGCCGLLYEDVVISHCKLEWVDLTSRSTDRQAVQFAKRIWPKFVNEFRARALMTQEVTSV